MLYPVARCAEFPNDNPTLHDGAIWRCVAIGDEASPELPRRSATLGPMTAPAKTAPRTDDAVEVIEVVEDLTFDAVEEEGDVFSADPFDTFAQVLTGVVVANGGDGRAVACLGALLGQARMDAFVPDDHATEALVAGGFVVRSDRGLVRAPAFTETVIAWQEILRGESEDFAPCGAATLDEWAASVVARVLGAESRADALRKELRRRGVAAFGFVAQAA